MGLTIGVVVVLAAVCYVCYLIYGPKDAPKEPKAKK